MLVHIRTIAIALLLGLTLGCGQVAEKSKEDSAEKVVEAPSKVDSSTQVASPEAVVAIEAFQKQALAALPRGMEPGLREFAEMAIRDREHLSAHRTTGRACFERIDGTLSAKEREWSVLFGKIDDLREYEGDCWEICSFGGLGNSIDGFLDAKTNKLLLLWIAPEG